MVHETKMWINDSFSQIKCQTSPHIQNAHFLHNPLVLSPSPQSLGFLLKAFLLPKDSRLGWKEKTVFKPKTTQISTLFTVHSFVMYTYFCGCITETSNSLGVSARTSLYTRSLKPGNKVLPPVRMMFLKKWGCISEIKKQIVFICIP